VLSSDDELNYTLSIKLPSESYSTMRITILSVVHLALGVASTTAKKRQRLPNNLKIDDLNNGFRNNPSATAHLLSFATRTDGTPVRDLEEYGEINSHIAAYSIQFQGCHHIQQWNSEDYYGDNVRVLTKRLVRFRLIPYETCEKVPAWAGYLETLKNSVGKFDDFGEYIIDLNEFVYSYLVALSEGEGSGSGMSCDDYDEACQATCGYANNDDADSCLTQCYNFYSCHTDDDAVDDVAEDDNKLDALDYAQCAQVDNYESGDDAVYDDVDGDNAGGNEFYVGPFCANHGAEIKMGLFSDNTCTITARCNGGASRGATCYEEAKGVALPYSNKSIVQDACITCSQNYVALSRLAAEENKDVEVEYEFGYTRDVCANLYASSGKCESYMSQGNKYENACDYIEGIKIAVNDEGVVYGVKRNGNADKVLLGLAIGGAVAGIYVYYLKYRLNSLNV